MISENYSVSFMSLVFLSDFVCCHNPLLGQKLYFLSGLDRRVLANLALLK